MKIVKITALLLITSLGVAYSETQYGRQPEEITEEVKYRFAPSLFEGIEFLKKEDVTEIVEQIKALESKIDGKTELSKVDLAKLRFLLKQVISYK